jgi:hypothetical protein
MFLLVVCPWVLLLHADTPSRSSSEQGSEAAQAGTSRAPRSRSSLHRRSALTSPDTQCRLLHALDAPTTRRRDALFMERIRQTLEPKTLKIRCARRWP